MQPESHPASDELPTQPTPTPPPVSQERQTRPPETEPDIDPPSTEPEPDVESDRPPASPADQKAPPTPTSPGNEPLPRRDRATDPGAGQIAEPPSSDPPSEVRVESAKPGREPTGTKYPARDGQRKYPARDRSGRRPSPPPARPITNRPSEQRPTHLQPTARHQTPPRTAAHTERKPSKRKTNIGIPAAAARAVRSMSDAPPTVAPTPSPVSLPPMHKKNTLPTPQMPTEGSLYVPKTAKEVMSLAMTRRMVPEDLEPIAAPVLLRRLLGRRTISGSLVVHANGVTLEADIDSGNANLTRGEHTELMQLFNLQGATWKLIDKRSKLHGRERYPLPRLALEGLRRILRGMPAEELAAAIGQDKLSRAPKLRPEHASVPKRLGLSGRERRFIEDHLDGETSGDALGKSMVLGASTCFQLLALLDLYSTLEWGPAKEPEPSSTPSKS